MPHAVSNSSFAAATPAEPLDDAQVLADFSAHVNPALAQVLQFIGFTSTESEARGCIVRDSTGREFLDCLGGYGTMSVGHSHPRIVAAAKRQLDKMAFSSRVLFNAPQAALAKKLAEISPGDLQFAFFCNSGAEAAEAAIKFARITTGRKKLISVEAAYHGKTMGALSVSGRNKYKTPFAPLITDVQTIPFNDIEALGAIDSETAAFLIEPIQGEGGINIASDEYLQAARRRCDEVGALLVMDEVQTGLGRTGKMWGCDHAGVAPDMMLLAKALSGGAIPIGAVLGTPKVWEFWNDAPLIHSSTFGGNPLACVVGLETLQIIEDEDLVAKSARAGEILISKLRETQAKFPDLVKDVRGRGLMIGIEFPHEDITSLVLAGLAQRDVLVVPYTFNNPTVTRFEPPLNISDSEIEWAATAFDEACAATAELLEGVSEM
ncbi:acetylornithine aminotransferase apoenzyme [Abditibacterium utsteinense]|uniref:Acetylornithine aminotransferase apoenzyme n=1 Tax=Abditibacterium utsteinense TaxID=1960156 RepID=A0A2S8SUH1_9BACT|nr:aspartate aminotransferase family protein [Abditibacterium utsteinense]PQV64445.1 acetylornithine aminotransferase apoenzyme [Abditibacterium utsteinense]